MGVFISLFIVSYIDYLKSIFKNTAVEWDVKTITAGDYSVEIQVTKKMWQTFLQTIYNPSLMRPKLSQFRDYFNREMSERLTQLPDLGFEDEPPEKINIALINFAFDNSQLINLLKERGSAIKFERFDEMRRINKVIDDIKSSNIDKFIRPVSAFLTFENEEGINRCLWIPLGPKFMSLQLKASALFALKIASFIHNPSIQGLRMKHVGLGLAGDGLLIVRVN